MQNAAFAAAGSTGPTSPSTCCRRASRRRCAGSPRRLRGANVTAPHKPAAAALAETDLASVNTLLFDGGRIRGYSTDAAILAGLPSERAVVLGDGGAAARVSGGPAQAAPRAAGEWPPEVDDADLVVNATPERDEVLVELGPGQTLVDLPYPGDGDARGCARGGCARSSTASRCRRSGRGLVRALDRRAGAGRGHAPRRRLARRDSRAHDRGESHGPALVGILTGLPAGLVLDRDAIDADLARRQQGYGRSPRQRSSTTGSRCSPGSGTGGRSARRSRSLVANRDHENWEWGMSPWPPEGEPRARGRSR